MKASFLACSALFLAAAIAPGPATAQVRFELGPVMAYYRPLGSFQPAPAYSVSLPRTPGDMAGPAFGGEARLWLGRHVGFELEAVQAGSTVPGVVTPASGGGQPTPVRVQAIGLQVAYTVHPTPATRVWVGVGPGLVRHAGRAYAAYGSPTQAAGTVTVGTNFPLVGRLGADLGVTTFFYSFDVSGRFSVSQRGFQTDPMLHVGLTWRS